MTTIELPKRELILPNRWEPRDYQKPAWGALERGCKRLLLIWPRRSGKDDFAGHFTACATQERIGTYWHMLPEYAQARKAIWDAIDPHMGMRRVDYWFPHELRARTIDDEMKIHFQSGSTWQLVGSDNFNALVGSPPIGIVASEWALAKPEAWDYLRAMLAENGGWIIFITTPRGLNHARSMFVRNFKSPHWFVEKLTVDDTKHIAPDVLAQERAEMPPNLFLQEYYCDFDAATEDALYDGKIIRAAVGREVTPTNVWPIWGVDVGGGQADGDRSTLARRVGNTMPKPVIEWRGLDTMQLAGRIAEQFKYTPKNERPSHIIIDSIGIGAGVVSRLKELIPDDGQTQVRGLNVAETAARSDRYYRLRDELWWLGKEWFEGMDVSCCADEILFSELSGATYSQDSNGLIRVESKKDMKKRLTVSPDVADGFLLTFGVTPRSRTNPNTSINLPNYGAV